MHRMTMSQFDSPREIGHARLACVRDGRSDEAIKSQQVKGERLRISKANISTTRIFWFVFSSTGKKKREV